MCTREPFVDYQVLTVTLGNQSQAAAATCSPIRKSVISYGGPITTRLISYNSSRNVT